MTSIDRASELEALLEVTKESIEACPSDKRAGLIREARALLNELDSAGATSKPEPEGSGLVDFQARLAERQSRSANQGRAARG